MWNVDSIEDAELGYLRCPREENVGVTGDGNSEADEFWVHSELERSISNSDILSLFLRSSTSCGSSNGLSFGDMVEVVCCAG